jgi:hypothetical protein
LRLEGKKLTDISPQHITDYDDEIRDAEKHIDSGQIKELHSATLRSELVDGPNRRTARYVLAIVLAYLYSGRTTQAHEELERMWPPFDQKSMWALILKTRREGVLAYTHGRLSSMSVRPVKDSQKKPK